MDELETKQMAAPIANDWGSRSHVQTLVLMAATAFGIYLCYRLAAPFLPALAWALALAVLFTPFQRWLESKLKRPSLAAGVSVLVIGLIVVVPATFVGQRLVVQAAKGAELIETKVKSGEWRRALEAQPRLAPLAEEIERQIDLPGTVKTLATWLSTTAGSIVKGSVFQVIGFCLTFYLLFFFLRDRRAALQSLRSLSPLSEAEMDRLFGRVGDTIYATVYGTLAVSAVQGLLGGLMFWWLGLPAPLLWGRGDGSAGRGAGVGRLCRLDSCGPLPGVGRQLGKSPDSHLVGRVIVGGIDNVLYPILVGNRLKLHTVLAFISVVGGLILFGPSGLILGPVALTVTMMLLEIWRSRTTAEAVVRVEPEELSGFESEGGRQAPKPGAHA